MLQQQQTGEDMIIGFLDEAKTTTTTTTTTTTVSTATVATQTVPDVSSEQERSMMVARAAALDDALLTITHMSALLDKCRHQKNE